MVLNSGKMLSHIILSCPNIKELYLYVVHASIDVSYILLSSDVNTNSSLCDVLILYACIL